MLDPHLLRSNPEDVAAGLGRRGFVLDLVQVHDFEQRRKQLQTETQQAQTERNQRSKEIGAAKARGEDIEPARAAVAELGERLKRAETALEAL